MNNCLLCNQSFVPKISYLQLFSLKKERKSYLCQRCLAKFELLGENRCHFCQKNLERGNMCQDCKYWQSIYGDKLLRNHALYRYNPYFHDLMVAYKRYGDYVLRKVLQELCYLELKRLDFDYYVPIPTSPEHQEKRQFDTIEAIYGDIVALNRFLKKGEGNGAQGEKNKQERLLTPQSFLIAKEIEIKDNKAKEKILLLDDIYTTGRTLYHARDKLLEVFPNARIESFSICH